MSIPRSLLPCGFTLIELVVGIVVMAVALTLLATLFFSAAGRSVEPILQIRAAGFGQALMEEILAKPFDETTPLGGVPACTSCTASGSFGSDGEGRANYDDVDDYHDSCASPIAITDALGNPLANFAGYTMQVCVSYDGNYDGIADTNSNAKLIELTVFLPAGAGLDNNQLLLNAYKGNY